MSAPEPIAFGLLGAGAIAQAYAQAFARSSHGRVTAVADARRPAAVSLAEQLGCPAYDDLETMLDRGGCHAVLVCTPPACHPEHVLAALDRGVPVLCEKPLSIALADARAMVEAAERAGVLLTMASKFRYVDDVIRAKSLLASGILGRLILFENSFTARVDMASRWNADPEVSGGGVLIDNGTHSVDLIRYFLGPIARVHAVEGLNVQGLPVEDTVRVFVETADGVMGSIDLSWSLNKELASYIDIYGSNGTVRVGWRESKYRQTGSPDWVVFGRGYDKVDAFRRQIDNFCRALRGEEMLLITAEDALASVEVIERAYQSLRANHWIAVDRDAAAEGERRAAGALAARA